MIADPSTPDTSRVLRIACLCAAWCRLCDGYGPLFDEAIAALRLEFPQLLSRWIDIEDESDLVGDFDVETFPTLVAIDDRQVLFAGPLTPQPETVTRVLRAALQSSGRPDHAVQSAEVQDFAARLRSSWARPDRDLNRV
jgi:hypothetical protein